MEKFFGDIKIQKGDLFFLVEDYNIYYRPIGGGIERILLKSCEKKLFPITTLPEKENWFNITIGKKLEYAISLDDKNLYPFKLLKKRWVLIEKIF